MYGILETDTSLSISSEQNSLIASPTSLQTTMIFNDNNLNTCEEMIYGTDSELVPVVMEDSLLDVNFMEQESTMDNLHYFNSISAYKTNVPKSILEENDVPTIMNDFHFQDVVVEEVAEEEIIAEPSDYGTATRKNSAPKRNRKIQLGKKAYLTSACSKKSQSINRSFLYSTRKKYECYKCGVTFCRKKSLVNHMQSHTFSVPLNKSYFAFNSVTKFSDQGSDVNMNEFSADNKKKYKLTHRDKTVICEECGEKMSDFRALANHRSIHHVTAARNGVLTTRTFPCYACSKVFGSRSSQQIHMRIHTGERPYNCKYCVKAFADGGTLRKHERIHTGEKPYVCPICRKAFNQRVVLREHIRAHHAGSSSVSGRLYNCEVCAAICDTPQELCSHLVKHSDDNTAKHRNIVNRPRKYKKWKIPERVASLQKPSVSNSTDDTIEQDGKHKISEMSDITIYIRDNCLHLNDQIETAINESKPSVNFNDLTIAFEKLPEGSVSSESCESGNCNDNNSCLDGEILNDTNSNSYFSGNDYEDCTVENELPFTSKEKYEFLFDSDYCVDSGLGLGAIVELT